jgi:hypothetical protein
VHGETQVLHLGTSLHFEYYEEAKQEAGDELAPGRQRSIKVPALDKYGEDERAVLKQLVKRFNVPASLRSVISSSFCPCD